MIVFHISIIFDFIFDDCLNVLFCDNRTTFQIKDSEGIEVSREIDTDIGKIVVVFKIVFITAQI
jgi:hypothetical protein